jgi:hypothetical protein
MIDPRAELERVLIEKQRAARAHLRRLLREIEREQRTNSEAKSLRGER